MGAAQNQGVHVFRQDRFQIFLGGQAGHRMIQPALFHERDEQGTSLGKNPNFRVMAVDRSGVGVAVHRRRGADDRHLFGLRRRGGAGGPGLDDVQDRYGRALLDRLVGGGGDGVAGDNQELDPLLQKKIGYFYGVPGDGFHGFDAVGHPGRIAEIDDVFKG